MDIQQTLLLPSQEGLVQRLVHIASYSEQLVLVSGDKGSGKTTLVTALASELENYNSALVICPMHADSAEIRRKILVQLISSPIFDDALPLSDTLVRIQASLTKPLHIIIDDAHLLPKELWAECLVLTQIQCAGKPVSLTFTVTTPSFSEFNELTSTMKGLLLNIEVEPLSLTEREGLYRTLLIRSNKTPFIPREILQAQIEKQSGTPAEVIALLKVALEDKIEPQKSWPKYFPIAVMGIILMLTVSIAWYFYDKSNSSTNDSEVLIFGAYIPPETGAQKFNANYGLKSLQPWLLGNKNAIISMPKVEYIRIVPANNDENRIIVGTVSESQIETLINANIQTEDLDDSFDIIETDKLQQEVDEASLDIAENNNVLVIDNNIVPLIERQGYTLQLVSVKEQRSLQIILSKLQNEKHVIQAKYKNRYIVLLGEFDDVTQAQSKAIELQTELELSTPWVRKYSDLKGYQLSLN